MKKRVVFLVFISLVALLVLAFAVPGCSSGAAAKDKILVGMSRPLSGPDQSVGDSAFKPIYDYFVKTWNADGGLNIGGKKMPDRAQSLRQQERHPHDDQTNRAVDRAG